MTLYANRSNRPSSVANISNHGQENGAHRGDLDAASKKKAELKALTFFELHAEADPEAQGPAEFN